MKTWYCNPDRMRVVYDALLGWLLEKEGGNLSLVISEETAMRLIAILARLRIDFRTQAGLNYMEERADTVINHED